MKCDFECTIIGAGIVGCALARRLVDDYPELLIIERHATFGEETSSRNSEVIHAGIYYEPGSRKAALCTAGRELLYPLCRRADIPHRKTGKLIVSTRAAEEQQLEALYARGTANGVPDLKLLSAKEVRRLEPLVACTAGLLSPDTGIVDTHRLMRYCLERARDGGAQLAVQTNLQRAERTATGYRLTVRTEDGTEESFTSERVVNAAGLDADTVAALFGIDCAAAGYSLHYAKGSYVNYVGPPLGIRHLVYPAPGPTSLGIHLVLDLADQYRFGPDIAFMAEHRQDYSLATDLCERFWTAIHRYLPTIRQEQLHEAYCGIRPKLSGPDQDSRDFIIADEGTRGLPKLVSLIGIESPGLTSALAIANEVATILAQSSR